jgi:hypothetical protein
MTTPLTFQLEDGHGPMVFHQEWISGGDDEVTFDLTCGAGLGSPFIHVSMTEIATGRKIEKHVDIREGLNALIGALHRELIGKAPQ